MSTIFIFQENTMEQDNGLMFACLHAGHQIVIVKYIPFVNIYCFKNDNDIDDILKCDKVVCFSGVTTLLDFKIWENVSCMVEQGSRLLDRFTTWRLKDKIQEGFFYKRSDFEQFPPHAVYQHLMFNVVTMDHSFFTFREMINENITFNEDRFIKPSSDLKWFKAGKLPKGTTLTQYLAKQTTEDITNSPYFTCWVLTAPWNPSVESMFEFRCFIIDGKFITGSFYGSSRKRFGHTSNDIKFILDWAQSYADTICNPATCRETNTFVMDLIFDSSRKYPPKIVELHCLNCSSVYESDTSMIIHTLAEKSKNEH